MIKKTPIRGKLTVERREIQWNAPERPQQHDPVAEGVLPVADPPAARG